MRWSIYFKNFGNMVRFVTTLALGKLSDRRRIDVLEFINRLNEESAIARFALVRTPEGTQVLNLRANLPPYTDKAGFGTCVDLWHQDCDKVRSMPSLDDEEAVAAPPHRVV